MSKNNKLFSHLSLIFIIIIFFFSYIAYNLKVSREVRRHIIAKETILQLIYSDLNQYFIDFERDTTYVSNIKIFGKHLNHNKNETLEEIITEARSYLYIKNKYANIIIRDINDNIIINESLRPYTTFDQAFQFFIKSDEKSLPKFSPDTIFSKSRLLNKDLVFSFTVPIFAKSKPVGTLTLSWNKKNIEDKIHKYSTLENFNRYDLYWFNLENPDLNSSLKNFKNLIGDQNHGTIIIDKIFLTFKVFPIVKLPLNTIYSSRWGLVIKLPSQDIIDIQHNIFYSVLFLAIVFGILSITFLKIILKEIENREFYKKQLEETNLKLLIDDKTKDKFISILAHDLKSPFTGITGIFNILTRKFDVYDDAKKKKLIFSLNDSVQGIQALLINLLEWSQIHRGNLKFSPIKVKVNDIMLTVSQLLQLNAETKNIKILNHVSDKHFIWADKYMVETIFRNILSNAIKFTPNLGKIEIKSKKNENFVYIYIKDSGIGMSLETQSKLFKLDGHISTPGTENEKGTGLGLIITKEFITLNRGKLEVESTKDKGTTFTLRFPIYKEI